MPSEPPAHPRAFVRAQIVQNDMQLLTRGGRAIETPQEPHKLLTAVA